MLVWVLLEESLLLSKEFMQVFEGNDRVHYNKYLGLSNLPGNEENVDSFLVAVNKKQPVLYSVDKTVHEFCIEFLESLLLASDFTDSIFKSFIFSSFIMSFAECF